MSRQWPEALRRRKVAEALRVYAQLLVEYERVRLLALRADATGGPPAAPPAKARSVHRATIERFSKKLWRCGPTP